MALPFRAVEGFSPFGGSVSASWSTYLAPVGFFHFHLYLPMGSTSWSSYCAPLAQYASAVCAYCLASGLIAPVSPSCSAHACRLPPTTAARDPAHQLPKAPAHPLFTQALQGAGHRTRCPKLPLLGALVGPLEDPQDLGVVVARTPESLWVSAILTPVRWPDLAISMLIRPTMICQPLHVKRP